MSNIGIIIHPKRMYRHVRSAALLRTRRSLSLHLGCGRKCLPGFVNVDCNHGAAVDYVSDIAHLPCPANSVLRIETYHAIEHLPHPVLPAALKHWWNILQPGGVLVIECPDFDAGVSEYLAGNLERLLNIYGRQNYRGDTHYFGYNRERLSKLLVVAGFTSVVEAAPQDYHAQLEPCLRFESRK